MGHGMEGRPRGVAFVTGELYGSVTVAFSPGVRYKWGGCVCAPACFVLNYACQRAFRACPVCVGLDPGLTLQEPVDPGHDV